MSACCPNTSSINGYGLRGKKDRFSNLTKSDIQNQCATKHLPPMGPPSTAEQVAYDDCVSEKLGERNETRLQTFITLGDWFTRTVLGRPRDQGGEDPDDPDDKSGSNITMWLVLFLIIIILFVAGYLIFRKK